MSKPDEAGQRPDTPHYESATGGWGSLKGVARVLADQRPTFGAFRTLMRQNKPGGHMCTSCAWTKPAQPHLFEFCENGAKATIWDLTRDRCTPDVLAAHSVTELRSLSDHELEEMGRLTHPMRYDAASDRYVETTWDEAFAGIGAKLRQLDPKSTVFYMSGKASLETAYLYALFARLYGHNNLPDSSNMCHETTSVGLEKVIGVGVGTCILSDFDHCDLILFFGQNTGTNSPRFLHTLKAAKERGCKVVTFNPIRERGLVEFADPQDPAQMTVTPATPISDIYLQVRPGGDIAVLAGLCKRVLELDAERGGSILDRAFIAKHTTGLDELEARLRGVFWEEIEKESGLRREELHEVAEIYATSKNVIGIYGMGLTQHVRGWLNLAMLVNLLLLRGNIGREGAGISPVRGHSNVQGQRTVGITEKPKNVPMDKLRELFGFEPPQEEGRSTVDLVEGLLDGSVRGFISLGGNLARAIPDRVRAERAWQGLDLNVQIATKLNRSHLLPGRATWLLPCLVRAEEDRQAMGPQVVTMEDMLSMIHGSLGKREPASPHLKSEVAIVAGIAMATLPPNPKVKWDEWTGNYGLIRNLIEATYPDKFRNFNGRLFTPGGFYKGNEARNREWKTESGKAQFTAPEVMTSLGKPPKGEEITLITLRSNDQFNTTIYGFSDRLRGLSGPRDIVLINPEEMQRRGLAEGQVVTLECAVEDGTERVVRGLRIVPYDLPDACVAAYYPEANPLIPVGYHDELSKTPAYKGVPVRIRPDGAGA
ncbi:FdhF/YdeP family oxidoreductase [Microvirga lotononidis]|uniref:Molybdopterin-dependent oxidoreductase alpha subunit n=1 Tax=Microvirga lotononidis TaxID=864069 RepID=I4YS32_9HYPH|nr:FdhF/YdeP family oxidoreductase [Microvirga lotononidis]EIM26774.1 molybdopterin-dependent oxidoreductase alpha subunit [Microvirga lotononidis]WQO31680.1 FdhF/YdeP family oxidoreductase [Microvirga lotononidis]